MSADQHEERHSNGFNIIVAALVSYVVSADHILSNFLGLTIQQSSELIEKKERILFITSILFVTLFNFLNIRHRFAVFISNIILIWIILSIVFTSQWGSYFDLPYTHYNSYKELLIYILLAIFSARLFKIKLTISTGILISLIWAVCCKLYLKYDGHINEILSDGTYFFHSWLFTAIASLFIAYAWLSPEKAAIITTIYNFKKYPISLKLIGKKDLTFYIIALSFLALYASFIGNIDYASNWTFYLGPIKSFREGFILLYNNPSQYGFLNIAIPAALPLATVSAFALCIIIVNYLYLALITFLTIAPNKNKNTVHLAASFFIAVCLLFMGEPQFGPLLSPSTTGYRFFPSLLSTTLLAMWLIKGGDNKLLLYCYCAAFLISAAWSFESFVFTLIPLISAIAIYFIVPLLKKEGFSWQTLLHISPLLAVLVIMPLTFIIITSFFYYFNFNLWPDWYAYIEYPKAYALRGITALPIRPLGTVLFLGLVFSLLSCYLYKIYERGEYLLFITYTVFFAYLVIISTYFVGRSHDNNLINLSPIYFSVVAYILLNSEHLKINNYQAILRSFLYSIFVICVITVGSNSNNWVTRFNISNNYFTSGSDKSLQALNWKWLNLHPDSYVIDTTINQNDQDRFYFSEYWDTSYYKKWAPVYPWDELLILEPHRADIYVDRSISKIKNSAIKNNSVFLVANSTKDSQSSSSKRNFNFILNRLNHNDLTLKEVKVDATMGKKLYRIVPINKY